MTEEKQKQVERESFDLGERFFRKLPQKKNWDYTLHKDLYSIRVHATERLTEMDKQDYRAPLYIQSGGVCLYKLENPWGEPNWDFSTLNKFISLEEHENISNTRRFSQRFAEQAFNYLISLNTYSERGKIERIIYDAFEPLRKRRRELSELVEGVDFGELEVEE